MNDKSLLLRKSLKIKLNPTTEQAKRIDFLLDEYTKACNFMSMHIASIQASYSESNKSKGKCSVCKKRISYKKKKMMIKDCKLVCLRCYKRSHSQFTIQKAEYQKKIGIRDVANMPKTYYFDAIKFVCDSWRGFDTICEKRKYKLKRMKNRVVFFKSLLNPENRIEKKFNIIKYASKEHMDNPRYYSMNNIKSEIRRLSIKIQKFKMPTYPEFTKRTMSLQKDMYVWKEPARLRINGIVEKGEYMDYFGKNYIKSYMHIINKQEPMILISKEKESFFIHFPISHKALTTEQKSYEPVGIEFDVIDNIAVMVIMTPKGKVKFVKFYGSGKINFKRRHFRSLRRKLGMKKRMDKIRQMHNKEARYINYQMHMLSAQIIDDIRKNSKTPYILMERNINDTELAGENARKNILPFSTVARLQNYIAYKAGWKYMPVAIADANEKVCHRCSHINHMAHRKLFKCEACNHTYNVYFNLAVNIAKKFFSKEFEPFDYGNDKMST